MAGNEAPSVNDIDTLFIHAVGDPGLAAQALETHGPRIDIWPSGGRTLGFGREDADRGPAAAYALAAAGALAVRASAGESDAAGILGEYRHHVGLTLRSKTMASALRGLQRGGGLTATLAIATNIADARSLPSLTETLGSEGPGSLVGDLAQGISDTEGNTINALHFANGSQVVRGARQVLSSYLARHFGIEVPEAHVPLYAYVALVQRTEALNHRNYPSSRVWLGAIVDAGDAITDGLSGNTGLDAVVHPDVFQVFTRAAGSGIVSRPAGQNMAGGSRPVPTVQRTAADAARLGMSRTKSTSPGRAVTLPADQGDITDTSYTGRKAAATKGSNHLRYLELLQAGIETYRACIEGVRQNAEQQRIARAQVYAALFGATEGTRQNPGRPIMHPGTGQRMPHLYQEYPSLQPFNVGYLTQAEQDLPNLVGREDITTIADGVVQLAGETPRDLRSRLQRDIDLGNGVAAASLLRFGSAPEQQTYHRLITHPPVREAAARQLETNLDLLLVREVDQLPPDVLARYGLAPGQARQHIRRLPVLEHTPVQLLVMAADVVNANANSVLPLGSPVRLRGRSAAELRAARGIYHDPTRNPHAKPTRRQLWREKREQKAAAYLSQKERVEEVTDTLRVYLEDRYLVPVDQDTRLLGFLSECAIAEELDFLNATPDVQARLARRLYRAARRSHYDNRPPLQPENIPPAVRPIYEQAMALVQREMGSRSGGILRGWLDTVFGAEH